MGTSSQGVRPSPFPTGRAPRRPSGRRNPSPRPGEPPGGSPRDTPHWKAEKQSPIILIWKIREAEKGRIPVGPRPARTGEPADVKILPLRLESAIVERMDDAWRSRGIKNRMEFFRRALGHYLTHLGAEDAAAMFATGTDVAG